MCIRDRVSDAGTPLISDPGYKLVQECYLNKVKVTHAPGPSSVINGLILSGLPTNQFYFGGFVSAKRNAKIKQFTLTKSYPMTGIWFDTCLRLIDTLKIMLKIYGNRKISITRELTKIYEDIITSDLENMESLIYERQLRNKPLKGEIVIIINGYTKSKNISEYIVGGKILPYFMEHKNSIDIDTKEDLEIALLFKTLLTT